MVDSPEIEPYIPQFFWRFWLSDAYVSTLVSPLSNSHVYFAGTLANTR